MKRIILIAASTIVSLFFAYACTKADSNSAEEQKSMPANKNPAERVVYLEAKRFSFSPDVIKVKMGEKVKIIARTLDVEHGFSLPEFNVKSDIEPGKENIIEFTADKKGTFNFVCSVYCGPGHSAMKGTLIVE